MLNGLVFGHLWPCRHSLGKCLSETGGVGAQSVESVKSVKSVKSVFVGKSLYLGQNLKSVESAFVGKICIFNQNETLHSWGEFVSLTKR